MWPVIIRELRASSRHWSTYGLRSLSAAAAIVAFLWFIFFDEEVALLSRRGSLLFATLHRVIFVGIWIVVPLLAADCLSRERREETLGLLFLTHLKAGEIVVAKVLARGLAALGLWAAVMPVTALPFLAGGLTWQEVALSFTLCFTALCATISAALLASALARRWGSAAAGAVTGSGAVFLGLVYLHGSIVTFGTGPIGLGSTATLVAIFFNFDNEWHEILANAVPELRVAFLGATAGMAAASLLLLVLSVLFAGAAVRRSWRDREKSPTQQQLESFFCTPMVLVSFFKRWMRRTLESNPVGWVELRSWSGRIVAFCWFAIMVSFSSLLMPGLHFTPGREDLFVFHVLLWLLLATMALIAAASFRRERENGVMELMLISPMPEQVIVSGRLRGLWMQFLPAFGAWLGIVLFIGGLLPAGTSGAAPVAQDLIAAIVTFFTLPIAGLYFSLAINNVIMAWALTLVIGVFVPRLLAKLCLMIISITAIRVFGNYSVVPRLAPWPVETAEVLAAQVAVAWLLGRRLLSRLARRSFRFQR